MLLRRPQAMNKSLQRNLSPNYNRLFQIVSVVQDEHVRAVSLCDAATGSTDLAFEQPVSVDRVILCDAQPLTAPLDDGSERTLVRINGKSATVKAVALDGRIHVQYDGSATTEVVDLTTCNYEWLN